MVKKILLISLISAANSTVALATPYVGGSLGLTNLRIYSSGKIQAGAIGKLFTGMGTLYGENRNIYLGGETNIDLAHYPYHTGATYGLGASFIPGVMVTNQTMVYGRIGLEAQRRTYSSTTHLGTQLGVGVQTNLTRNWDIRGEYIRTTNLIGGQLNLGLVYKFG